MVVQVGLWDDSAEATLTLWDVATSSASGWKPSRTILLFTSPGCALGREKVTISLKADTLVDVDPDMPETTWLRRAAEGRSKRSHVNPPFPAAIFDASTLAVSDTRILFTLADVEEQARSSSEPFSGFLSVIVTEVNLAKLHARKMLMSTECCGVPVYSNHTTAICKQCETAVEARLDAKAIGSVIDETGRVAGGKLIWSDLAWQQLLGQAPEELSRSGPDVLRAIDMSLTCARVTLVFGWSEEAGRLAIARVLP